MGSKVPSSAPLPEGSAHPGSLWLPQDVPETHRNPESPLLPFCLKQAIESNLLHFTCLQRRVAERGAEP